MHGTFFDIGLGLGLATACGLRPYLPALLAGVLARAPTLGVRFPAHDYTFLQAGWWLVAIASLLVLAYLAQLRLGAERFDRLAGGIVLAQSIAIGALLFAGTLQAHGELSWPGLLGGAAAAAVAALAAIPVIAGARARLADRNAREALTLYLDGASLLAAAVVALLHPLGYVLFAALLWFAYRRRARGGRKYAGLRILRR